MAKAMSILCAAVGVVNAITFWVANLYPGSFYEPGGDNGMAWGINFMICAVIVLIVGLISSLFCKPRWKYVLLNGAFLYGLLIPCSIGMLYESWGTVEVDIYVMKSKEATSFKARNVRIFSCQGKRQVSPGYGGGRVRLGEDGEWVVKWEVDGKKYEKAVKVDLSDTKNKEFSFAFGENGELKVDWKRYTPQD